ncbi:hypothetical protein [Oleidesulfovibrio sp.]|uniref:hypothetical protein n=1 Tax=Oleidesulfovibrio sp. TaxID=2909707 RepID=UPI003A8A1BD0
MRIDEAKGGAEGIVNVLEAQRQTQQQQMTQEDQNNLNRVESRQSGAQTETGVAIQGLGEHIDTMV